MPRRRNVCRGFGCWGVLLFRRGMGAGTAAGRRRGKHDLFCSYPLRQMEEKTMYGLEVQLYGHVSHGVYGTGHGLFYRLACS